MGVEDGVMATFGPFWSHTFHRCEAPGDNIFHMFLGNCSQDSHIFLVIAVQHITVQLVLSQLAIQI